MVPRITKEEKAQIIELRKQGKSFSTIAGLTGRSSSAVVRILKEANLYDLA